MNNPAKILGIDEAGRGPVIGSMFIAGVVIRADKEKKLKKLGVKDSKQLTAIKREDLVPEIEKLAEKIVVKEVKAKQIDELREVMSLNAVEVEVFAQIIKDSEPDSVIIDLPEQNSEKFVMKVKAKLKKMGVRIPEIKAENKADENYPVVSAASIIAKSNRERHVRRMYEKYGVNFRTGYPHDSDTIKFLEDYVRKNRRLPEEARKSWSTAQRILEHVLKKQKKINDY